MARHLFTSESVTEGHPDKICDQISDAILDEILTHDPEARVACETCASTGLIHIMGEITTNCYVDIAKIARQVVLDIGYDRSQYGFDGNTCAVITNIDEQSSDIALGVDKSYEAKAKGESELDNGAGDQGMMFGYACDETPELMPLAISIAQKMAKRLTDVRKQGLVDYLRPDGKAQVTVEYDDDRPVRVEAVVLSISVKEQKISLGVRQLEDNPWADIESRFPIGTVIKGQVRNLTPYGAFVGLEEGIDGMIHVSDMSWTRKINHPSEVLKKGDEVEAIVLEIKKEDQRVSLGIKQLESDPWESINDRFKVGDMVTGQVAKIASFGAFVNLNGDIDGLIHISQLSEDHVERVKDVIKVGDEITARVIKVDSIERRIGLSIKAVNYDTEQLRRETASFEALRPSSDMVGLEHAFNLATRENEEWSPSEEK
mgnify:CR=1 FL=1